MFPMAADKLVDLVFNQSTHPLRRAPLVARILKDPPACHTSMDIQLGALNFNQISENSALSIARATLQGERGARRLRRDGSQVRHLQ